MTEPPRTDEPDLDLQPVRPGPSRRSIAVTIGLLAATGAAIALNNHNSAQRKTERLQRAADAWANLSQCLMGAQPVAVGQVARRARRMELAVPPRVARLPAAQRRREWPYRCATHAGVMTRALFDSKSDERGHRLLAMVVSQAATDLEAGQLHTGKDDRRKYLDELYAVVEQASLPPGARSGDIPAPPTPADPASAPLLDALFAGPDNARPMAQDALAQGTLRVLFGLSERRICTFGRGAGDAGASGATGLGSFSCVRARPADFTRDPWLGSSEDGEPAAYGGRARGTDPADGAFFDGTAPLGDGVRAASVMSTHVFMLRWDDPRRELSLAVYDRAAARQEGAEPVSLLTVPDPVDNRRGRGWLFGDVAVALASRTAVQNAGGSDGGVSDAGSIAHDASARAGDGGAPEGPGLLYAGVARRDANGRPAWALPLSIRGDAGGPWAAETRVEACRASDGALAIVAYEADGHALVLWRSGTEFLPALRAEARPGTIACDGDRLRIGWFEPVPSPTAHVTTCSRTSCAHARATAPDLETDPVIAPLGSKVLAVYTLRTENGGHGGLRYRLAPLADLVDADERVIFDDGEHEGLQVEPSTPVFVRDGRAVVLVTSKGVAGESYAFRINADGTFDPVRRSAPLSP
jgi:hypothetical protein